MLLLNRGPEGRVAKSVFNVFEPDTSQQYDLAPNSVLDGKGYIRERTERAYRDHSL